MSDQYEYLLHKQEEFEKVIYGDSRMGGQRRGIAQTVAALEPQLTAINTRLDAIQSQLSNLLPVVQSTDDKTQSVYRGYTFQRRNRYSDFFGRITLTLATIIVCTPVLVSDLRKSLFGHDAHPALYLGALGIALAMTAILTVVTRAPAE
jgi:hypothetical protein